jgi:hypothetical protein
MQLNIFDISHMDAHSSLGSLNDASARRGLLVFVAGFEDILDHPGYDFIAAGGRIGAADSRDNLCPSRQSHAEG